MGRPKTLLLVDGRDTFTTRLVRTLREGGVDDVLVVAPADGPVEEIKVALAAVPPEPRVVVNPNPSRGQLSSLLVGLGAIDRPGVAAVLIALVDVPLVSPGTVSALLDAYAATRPPIVRPTRPDDKSHGHPVIFDRAVFGELRQASFQTGAKDVVRAHEAEITNVPVDDDGAFQDIDTPEDYQRIFGRPLPDEV